MKPIITIMMSLVVQNSVAKNETYNYHTHDPGCPNVLGIIEQKESGRLASLTIIKANKTFSKYEAENIVCHNLHGATVQNDGIQVTCWVDMTGPNEYTLSISNVEPPRDPSDYGIQKNYTVEKALNGVIAHWDQRYYDGKPIYCGYISGPAQLNVAN